VSAARRKSAAKPRAARRAGTLSSAAARSLMAAAVQARAASHSPYSRFAVGAALLTESGAIFHGCNVENASYGLTCCAERTAVFKAVSEGERRFVAIAVTAREGQGAPPCGACRQVMSEFAPDLLVYWRDARGRILHKSLSALLPDQFQFVKPTRSAR
ncbi:MAG: cytidine deaminase, partial [Candidatus Eisenbacteria bacterium]